MGRGKRRGSSVAPPPCSSAPTSTRALPRWGAGVTRERRRQERVSDTEIVTSFDETGSVATTAHKFGVGQETVTRVLDKLGVARPHQRRGIPDEEIIDAFCSLDTPSASSVARLLHIDRRVASRVLNKPEYQDRLESHRAALREERTRPAESSQRHHWTPEEEQLLQEEYTYQRSQNNLSSLAEALGITKRALKRKAELLGLADAHASRGPYDSKWKLGPPEARKLFDEFSHSRHNLTKWCDKKKLDRKAFSRLMSGLFREEWEIVVERKEPDSTLYFKGRKFELLAQNNLKSYGLGTRRSYRSRGVSDLWATQPGGGVTYEVQCKIGGYISPGEWNRLFDYACKYGAIPLLADNLDGGGKSVRYWLLTGRKSGEWQRQPRRRVFFDSTGNLCGDDGKRLSVTALLVEIKRAA